MHMFFFNFTFVRNNRFCKSLFVMSKETSRFLNSSRQNEKYPFSTDVVNAFEYDTFSCCSCESKGPWKCFPNGHNNRIKYHWSISFYQHPAYD